MYDDNIKIFMYILYNISIYMCKNWYRIANGMLNNLYYLINNQYIFNIRIKRRNSRLHKEVLRKKLGLTLTFEAFWALKMRIGCRRRELVSDLSNARLWEPEGNFLGFYRIGQEKEENKRGGRRRVPFLDKLTNEVVLPPSFISNFVCLYQKLVGPI